MVKHFSIDVDRVVRRELFLATKSIKLAIPWFNNNFFYSELFLRSESNFKSELILEKNEINTSPDNLAWLDLERHVNQCGILRWCDSNVLIHDKFCIIDDKIVITGSYSWTSVAMNKTEEITIYYDEPNITDYYLTKFEKLSNKHEPVKPKLVSNNDSDIKNDYWESIATTDDKNKGTPDEYAVIYSPDGKRLLKGANISSYIVKEGTEILCDYAFEKVQIDDIVLPQSLKIIGKRAFADCGLKSITIPPGVNKIKSDAFKDCEKLQSVSIHNDDEIILEYGIFYGCNNLKEIRLPEKLKVIPSSLFSYSEKLTNINLPSEINTIEHWAFYKCRNLANLYLPNAIEVIEERAFADCISLNTQLPSNLKSIGHKAFENCKTIEEIRLPKNLKQIIGNPFCGCSPQKVTSDSPNFVILNNGIYSADRAVLYSAFGIGDNYYVLNGVIEISESCFEGSKFKRIHLPDTVCKIGKSAFKNCRRLEKIIIPQAVNVLTSAVFKGCYNLQSVDLSPSLVSIDSCCFEGCKKLKSINLPVGLRKIDGYAFKDCEKFDSIKFPKSLREISSNAFSGTSIRKFYLPTSILETRDFCDNCPDIEIIIHKENKHVINYLKQHSRKCKITET